MASKGTPTPRDPGVGAWSPRWWHADASCATAEHIAALCITQGLPPLWTLIVRASTGLPADYWREHTDKEKADRQNECFAYYGAVREPEGGVLDLCPDCFTERTLAGTCMC